jgi:hypothetical protein
LEESIVTRQRFSSLSIFALLLCGCAGPSKPTFTGKPTKADLDKALSNVVAAAEAADESAFKYSVSANLYAKIRNNLAMAKKTMEKSFFSSLLKPLQECRKGTFLTLLEKDKTAALVFQEPREKGQPQGYSAARFVWENDGWKLDAMGSFSGKGDTFDPSMLPPTLAVDGKVREAETLVETPDYVGEYFVVSFGYKAILTINGVPQTTVTAGSSQGLVKGGLKKGKNTITIAWTPESDAQMKKLEVTVKCRSNDKDSKEVLNWSPKKADGGTEDVVIEVP